MGAARRILVADDDPGIRRIIARTLAPRFEVLTAAGGDEAVSMLERGPVDAVLCDHLMPERSGVEVLAAAHKLQPQAARILVTASDRVEDARDAVNLARVHRFLVKPLRLLDLEDAIAGAMREAELQHENERLVDELRRGDDRLEEMVKVRTEELQQALTALSELAVHDGLTGLYDHRFLQEALGKMIAKADRSDTPVGLLFLDVDHFKHYNDTLGHLAGDEVLRTLGKLLVQDEDRARASDVAARYGGEEFVVALPDTDRAGALAVAERLRQRIERHPFGHEEVMPGGRVTMSIGVAAYPEDASTKEGLIEAADRALYRAKGSGRNRVAAVDDEEGGGDGHRPALRSW